MPGAANHPPLTCAIGIDLGGTKCGAGAIVLPEGRILASRIEPTRPERGGEAVLADVIGQIQFLKEKATESGLSPATVGIGVPELVDPEGNVVSEATIRWRDAPVAARVAYATGLQCRIAADVRAAALAEARLGAGRDLGSFLYITIGTGISAAQVIDGRPYVRARGFTGTFGSSPMRTPSQTGELLTGQPLEQFASGPALAARLAAVRPEFRGTAIDILALAADGDPVARDIAATGGCALGAAIAHLVNVLDPHEVVLGGGLGLAGGIYRESLIAAVREFVYAPGHREIAIRSAELGADAGWIGAALASLE